MNPPGYDEHLLTITIYKGSVFNNVTVDKHGTIIGGTMIGCYIDAGNRDAHAGVKGTNFRTTADITQKEPEHTTWGSDDKGPPEGTSSTTKHNHKTNADITQKEPNIPDHLWCLTHKSKECYHSNNASVRHCHNYDTPGFCKMVK